MVKVFLAYKRRDLKVLPCELYVGILIIQNKQIQPRSDSYKELITQRLTIIQNLKVFPRTIKSPRSRNGRKRCMTWL